mmetsp:Transcript_20104/g.26185  ORF Transcript_20104/g.26185 Transcript_20104/m.26185 type:complete len:474 (+) Transcript_20104:221-1642(+)
MMNEDGSVDPSSYQDDSEEEEEEDGQVIEIDVSTSGLIDPSVNSLQEIKALESKIKAMNIEHDELKKVLLEQKELMIHKEKEWRDNEKIRLARETEIATKQAKEETEKAEKELDKLKAQTTTSESQILMELKTWKTRAQTAETQYGALKHEFTSFQESSEVDRKLAVEEALNIERIKLAKETKNAENLTMELMNEMSQMKKELNKSQSQSNKTKTQLKNLKSNERLQIENTCLKKELNECRLSLKSSEESYEQLLKTLAEAKEPSSSSDKSSLSSSSSTTHGGDRYEDRAVLGQACREAERTLTLIDHQASDIDHESTSKTTSTPATSSSSSALSNLSASVVEVIGNPIGEDGTPVAAALAIRKLSSALVTAHNSKIAIDRFNVGEVAMFFPIPKKGTEQEYVAFSAKRNKEKHFLAHESKELIGKSQHFKEAYVLGRVVHKELLEADDSSGHLSLKPGAKYYSVTVSALPFD